MDDAVVRKILFVDDEVGILDGFKRQFRNKYDVFTAPHPDQAFELIKSTKSPFPVIVSDMRMPGVDGVQFLHEVQKVSPESVRIMLTGNADQDTAVSAVNNSNIFRFLLKPCSTEDLTKAIEDGIHQYTLVVAERELLQNTLSGSVKLLTDILSLVDPTSFGISLKIRELSKCIATALKLPNAWELELASMLSNIGLVTVPSHVMVKLRKGHALQASEKQMLGRTAQIGFDLIKNIPRLEKVAKLIQYQNKNFDGTGVPQDELKGKDIPIGSRVIKAAKDLAEMRQTGLDSAACLKKMQGQAAQYDPAILDILIDLFNAKKVGAALEQTNVYEVSATQLIIGQTLISPVETSDGVLLISAGNKINETLLARLRNYARTPGLKEPIKVDCLMPTESN